MSTLLDTPTGRLGNGRFAPGNSGGPGNPNGRQTAQLRQALFNALTEEDMAIIVKALIDKAKEGNMQAIKMVLHYTIGKPTGAPLSWNVRETAADLPSTNGQYGGKEASESPSLNGENGTAAVESPVTPPIANGQNGQPASNQNRFEPKLSGRALRKMRKAVKRAAEQLAAR